MKYLTIPEIRLEINDLLVKRNFIQKPIEFDDMSFVDALFEILKYARMMEYKSYNKNFKRSVRDLRWLYLLLEKYIQHEKRDLLALSKQIDEFKEPYEEIDEEIEFESDYEEELERDRREVVVEKWNDNLELANEEKKILKKCRKFRGF
jgi:hypothetical protein